MEKRGAEEVRGGRAEATKTGIGCDGFHPEVPLDLARDTRKEVVECWNRWNSVGDGRKMPAQRCSF